MPPLLLLEEKEEEEKEGRWTAMELEGGSKVQDENLGISVVTVMHRRNGQEEGGAACTTVRMAMSPMSRQALAVVVEEAAVGALSSASRH